MRVLFALETLERASRDHRPLRRLLFTVGASALTVPVVWLAINMIVGRMWQPETLTTAAWFWFISFAVILLNLWSFWWAFFTARLDIKPPTSTFVTKPEDYNGN